MWAGCTYTSLPWQLLRSFAAQYGCTCFCFCLLPPFLPGVSIVIPVHGIVNTSNARKESALMHFNPLRCTFNQSNANIPKCLYVYCSTQGHATDKDVHNQYKSPSGRPGNCALPYLKKKQIRVFQVASLFKMSKWMGRDVISGFIWDALYVMVYVFWQAVSFRSLIWLAMILAVWCTGITGKLLEFSLNSRTEVHGSFLPSCFMLSLKTFAFIPSIYRHIDMHRSPSQIQVSFHV